MKEAKKSLSRTFGFPVMQFPTSIDRFLNQPFGSIADLVAMHAVSRPRQPAIVQGAQTLDYAGLDALMDRVASALQREGLQPGDAIAICAATSIAYAAVFLGALRAGIAVVPLAPSATGESLVKMITDAGVGLLFLDEATATTFERSHLRVTAKCIGLGYYAADTSLDAWLATATMPPRRVDVLSDWPFNLIYSSGTTGVPKGIVQPHSMRWAHVQRGPVYGYGPDCTTLLSTPLYSNTTLVAFFPALGLGGTIVLMAKFDVAGYLALAEEYKVTHTMLVPVQYQRIMAFPDFHRYDLSSFRTKLCTSAPFATRLKAEILARWPGGLVEYYGLTEGGGTCVLAAHEHPTKLHTVGRPAPKHDIRLIDEEGREIARGGIGEVVGHSAGMMTGYHKQPQQTAEAEWHDTAGKRFIRTGDVARFDADGFLILLERKKDMIISGGFNVYPSDLEAVLLEHADVGEVAVIGVPSTRWGETPIAYVVPKSEARLDTGQLLEWANNRLAKTQRLGAVMVTDNLPRSPIGKVLKRELRDAYHRAAGASDEQDSTSFPTHADRANP